MCRGGGRRYTLPVMSRFAILGLCLLFGACAMPAPAPAPTEVSTSSSSIAASSALSTSSLSRRTGSAAVLGQRLLSGGILEIGDASAPHVLLAVVNHGSDYSRTFLTGQLPRVLEEFTREGVLRIRLLPLRLNKVPESDAFASAVVCAAQQGKGWEMSEVLAVSQTPPQTNAAITSAGLDAAAYKECLVSPALSTILEDQRLEAERLGVSLVPTFFLNGERFQGLPDYPDLRGRIREALRNAEEVSDA